MTRGYDNVWLVNDSIQTEENKHSQRNQRSGNSPGSSENQWPCNRNRLIGGTDSIYKAYFLGLCKGISPENMA